MIKETMIGRDGLMTQALFALKAARNDDMLALMLEAVDMYPHVSKRDRSLIGVSIKNVIDPLRFAIIRLSDASQEPPKDPTGRLSDSAKAKVTIEYREKLFKELCHIVASCLKRIGTFDIGLIGHNDDPESKVFFFKLAADLTRYVAEATSSGAQRRHFATIALENYKLAMNESHRLPPCNPVRLSAVLNFSVFYYEILNAVENASALAQRCFNEAVESLSSLEEETYEESMGLLDTLHSNLVLWQNVQSAAKDSIYIQKSLSPLRNERSRAESSKPKLDDEDEKHSYAGTEIIPRRNSTLENVIH